MEHIGSLYGGKEPLLEQWPVYGGGSNIIAGAAVMRGTTLGTNLNFAILATGALTDIIGVLQVLDTNTSAGADTNAAGTNYTTRAVVCDPFAIYRAEYDQTDTMAVASVSDVSVTVTSGETNMQGGYLYAVGGTGVGRLTLVTTDNGSGVYTTKEATGWDSTTTLIKIVPRAHQLVKLNSTADKIGSDAAAGSGVVTVRDIKIKADALPLQSLDPRKHSGLTGLNSQNVQFFAELIFRNHIYNTID